MKFACKLIHGGACAPFSHDSMNGLPDSQFHSFKIYALDPEFYSGQDTHKRTNEWTNGRTINNPRFRTGS